MIKKRVKKNGVKMLISSTITEIQYNKIKNQINVPLLQTDDC